MNITGITKNAIDWSARKYAKNPATFMNVTTAACFSYLCLGEAVAIQTNKNIPEKQKKFMVPQAICEGLLNVGIILSVSTALQKMGSKLVQKGLILPKGLPENFKKPEFLTKIIKAESFETLKLKGLKRETYDLVRNFKDGIATITGPLVGLFTALNVLSPIGTNKMAKLFKDKTDQNELSKNSDRNLNILVKQSLNLNNIDKMPAFKRNHRLDVFAAFTNKSLYFKAQKN